MHKTKTLQRLALATTLMTTLWGGAAHAVDISFFRFFGDCKTEYGEVTDVSKANGECGIITALTNKFNAENTIGAKVVTQTVDWGAYYDLLTATYSTGNIPDVAVMHASVMPNFSDRDLLTPLSKSMADLGIDTKDFVPAALKNASSGDEVYALPYDLHALLLHVNMDLMKQAGLVNADGSPVLPKSPEELLAQGKQFKEKTGKYYIGSEAQSAEGMMVRVFDTFQWQQGVDVISGDGKTASINTAEGLNAAKLVSSIFSEGLANAALDYPGSEQAFLNGETGILINGTWGVDNYDTQAKSGKVALKDYRVANFPQVYAKPAVWADSHMWVIPKDDSRSEEKTQAALAFLKFLNDNNFQWSRTGHLSVRQSVLNSDEFKALPHRAEFADTANNATALPQIQNQRAVYNAMITDFNAMWLTGTEPQAALEAMQSGVERVLRRNR
ncbi:multiple sugar transport system substrate-binding protein [Pararhizobium capsulatum DSM 1112]|uniref:Multiple sugar transport system substrate-binding protein n=1 Tax=Pararhizobium capsulatum DSM 1112 TaxID=1121113 RepID=A0ABU0BXH2_9HYPH|nr:extracellular solute-binding protein [Pararhizobium capsulatum]MDQ0322389.1 multiple sugar transport system substrate-binding protein [Pararhizobium capsulatum DSM 1112]